MSPGVVCPGAERCHFVRFVWAVVAFVLAAGMIGAGIVQRTLLQGPTTESQSIQIAEAVPYILIDGAVLNSHDGAQTLRAEGDGEIFAAYGRTADLTAWLAASDYDRVSMQADEITTTTVRATQPPAAGATAPSPKDSDLWLDQFAQDDVLVTPLQLPEDMSLLVAADGIAPAPGEITLTWPTGITTPWAGPLIVGGSIFLVIGLVLYYLGIRHARRSRGPRRKGLPMPVTEPIEVSGADKGVISATPSRRRLTGGRRGFAVLPVVLGSALVLSGCSADAWPQFGSSPTPSPSASIVVPEDQGPPAVTEAQAAQIVERIAETVATADETIDSALAATRLAGTALAVRETNYRLRAGVPDEAALPAIPDGPIQVLLPEARDGWPRTFLAVVGGSGGAADTIMSVTQADPWSAYKAAFIADLAADTSLNLAPPYVGAVSIDPDSPFMVLPPGQVAAAYADLLTNGKDSTYAAKFDTESDTFRTQLASNRAERLESFNTTGSETGTMTFSAAAGDAAPIALATLDSGAIVAVTVTDTDAVAATNADAVIKVDDNATVKTLAGVTQSPRGFTTTFADQLFFFVPSQSSNERIQFLGFSSSVLDAKEIPE